MILLDYIEQKPELLVLYLTSPLVNGVTQYQHEPTDLAEDYNIPLEKLDSKNFDILCDCFNNAYATGYASRTAMNRVIFKMCETDQLPFLIRLYEHHRDLYTFLARILRRFIIKTEVFEKYYDMVMICEKVSKNMDQSEDFIMFVHPKNTAWRYDFLLRNLENRTYHSLADDEAYEVTESIPTLAYRLCRIALGYCKPETDEELQFSVLAQCDYAMAIDYYHNVQSVSSPTLECELHV